MDAGNLLDKVSDHLSVRRAFGAAYEKDGTLIIPVALVGFMEAVWALRRTGRRNSCATGRGGLPEGEDPAHDAAPQDPEPRDAGGGFGGLVLPVGVYVVKGDQVRWVPAVAPYDDRRPGFADPGLGSPSAWTRRRLAARV